MTISKKAHATRMQTMEQVRTLAIGIDAGGTAIKLRGNVGTETVNITVDSGKGKEQFFDAVVKGIREVESRFDMKASKIAISIPGPGDGTNFIITNVAPGEMVNIKEELASRGIRCEVQGVNDADAVGIGVANFTEVVDYIKTLEGKKTNVIAMTIGTGIGLAHIAATKENGSVKLGLQNGQMGSGELHHPVEGNNGRHCNCGQVGCLETTAASTSGQVERAKQLVREVVASGLRKRSVSWGDITSELRRNDAFSMEVVRQAISAVQDGGGSMLSEAVAIATRMALAVRETSLVSDLDKMFEAGRSADLDALERSMGTLTARDIDIAASNGDPLAEIVMHEGGRLLGIEAASQVNAMEASVLILAGGGANTPESGAYRKAFEEEFSRRVMAAFRDNVRVFWVPQTEEQNLGLDGAIELAGKIERNEELDRDGRDRTKQAIQKM